MKSALSKIAQLAIFTLGTVLCVACSWLLVRFFAYGDNHPINVALGQGSHGGRLGCKLAGSDS